ARSRPTPGTRRRGQREERIPHQGDFTSTTSFEKAPDPHEHCRQLAGAPAPSEHASRRAAETKASGRMKNAPDRKIRGVSTSWMSSLSSDSVPDTHPSGKTGGPPNEDRSETKGPRPSKPDWLPQVLA